MDKVRLKRIRNDVKGGWTDFHEDDMNWLLSTVEEQQKEIEELDRVTLSMEECLVKNGRVIMGKEDENARLREALEFYADEETHEQMLINEASYNADGICISNDEYAPPVIYFDKGKTARQALAGESK